MRRLFSTFIALAFTLCAMADGITQEQALNIAAKFFSSSNNVAKAKGSSQQLTVAKTSTGYYAINRGNGSGYVIVATTDKLGSEVLGYADEGSIDTQNMPDNLRWWLSEYDRQVAYAANHSAKATSGNATKSSRPAIKPLLTSLWNQAYPYNLLCPQYEGQTCPTGCVATAIAQLMYYHKWPLQGTGSISYTWSLTGNTLTKDFSQSTYDWDNMTDTYNSSSSDDAKNAVAQLMVDAGYATQMQYTPTVSNSNAILAIQGVIEYFSYDKGAHVMLRDFYSSEDWHDSLYSELAASRPIFSTGTDANGQGGHAFVLDGYQDGYYHFNWGWSGSGNGYFLMTDLQPSNQGVGGNSAGFSYNINAVIGIKPAVEGSVDPIDLLCDGNFGISGSETVLRTGRQNFTGKIYLVSTFSHSFICGLKVVDSNGNATYLKGNQQVTFAPMSFYAEYSVDMKDFPTAEGNYDVYPAYYETERGEWIDVRPSDQPGQYFQSHVVATVTGNQIKYSNPSKAELLVKATDVSIVNTKVYAGKTFKVTATITATKGNYYGLIRVGYRPSQSSAEYEYDDNNLAQVDLAEGESQTLTFAVKAPSTAGDYDMDLFATKTDDKAIGETQSLHVNEAPTGALELEIEKLSMPSTTDVDPMNLNITLKVKCRSGIYDGRFYAYFFKPDETISNVSLSSDNYVIAQGEEATVTFSGACTALEYGTNYNANFYYMTNNWVNLGYCIDFTTVASSGIESIEGESSQQPISIYSINGELVDTQNGSKPNLSTLPKGIYVVKIGGKTVKMAN